MVTQVITARLTRSLPSELSYADDLIFIGRGGLCEKIAKWKPGTKVNSSKIKHLENKNNV